MLMWEKSEEQLCPEVHFRRTSEGIRITGCYGTDGELVLPDEIEGEMVTEIGDYAFAQREQAQDEEIWLSPCADLAADRHKICGSEVTMVWLPVKVREIGRYAFYRCRNLKKLILTDSLPEIGGGALTGCRISEAQIHFYDGRQSCLKSILDEIRYELRADLRYEDSGERVRVLFPEHYEEAVENTPARLLVTHHHGAGGYYRQCFYDRELDYKKYDETFFRARAEEEPETTAELVLCRLRYPHGLSREAEQIYEAYVKAHMADVAAVLIRTEDMDGLRFLMQRNDWSRESMDQAVEMAAEAKKTEMLSLLIDERHRRYSASKKTFEL